MSDNSLVTNSMANPDTLTVGTDTYTFAPNQDYTPPDERDLHISALKVKVKDLETQADFIFREVVRRSQATEEQMDRITGILLEMLALAKHGLTDLKSLQQSLFHLERIQVLYRITETVKRINPAEISDPDEDIPF